MSNGASTTHAHAPSRQEAWALYLGPLAVVAIAYGWALSGGFVFDDVPLIVQDARTHRLAGVLDFFREGFLGQTGASGPSVYFRPLVQLSFAVDWALGGGKPFVFHLTNLLAHLATVALVIAVARRLGATPLGAGLTALLFGLMPRLTESVAWISGRTDVFATLFGLAALLLAPGEGRVAPRRVAVGALLLCSLLCKEVGVAWVGVVGLHALLGPRFGVTKPGRALGDALAPAVALVAWLALRATAPTVLSARLAPPTQLLAALGTTLHMAAVPWFPNLQIGMRDEHPAWAIALGAVGLAVWGLLLWRSWRNSDGAGLSLTAGAGVALFLAVGFHSSQVLTADRLLYVPLAMAAPAVARRLPTRGNLAALALGVLALSFLPATVSRTSLWADELRLWEVSVRDASPTNGAVRVGLFTVYLERVRLDDALATIDEAVALHPGTPLFDINQAAAWSLLGRDDEAIAAVGGLRRRQPGNRLLAMHEMMYRLRAGRFEEARAVAAQAQVTKPGAFEAAAVAFAPDGPQAPSPMARARALAELGAMSRARLAYLKLAFETGTPDERKEALEWLAKNAERDDAVRAAEALSAMGAPDEDIIRLLTWRFGADITGG